MEYRIVDAEEKHLKALHEIENECFSMPWTTEMLKAQLKDQRHEFIIAEDGEGNVLGYVGMMYVIDEGYISNVAVSAKYRRQGVADALIDALNERAEALTLAFMTLEVRRSNLPAIRLYEKHGFAVVGSRRCARPTPRPSLSIRASALRR